MEINGLPLHPLVVHAAVIFGPIGALAGLLYVVLPSWRDRLRKPLAALAVVAGLAVVAAYLSGDNFLESRPELRALPAVETHEEWADLALWSTLVFAAIALATAWLHERKGAVRIALLVLLAVSSVAALVAIVLTGDAGARAVWG